MKSKLDKYASGLHPRTHVSTVPEQCKSTLQDMRGRACNRCGVGPTKYAGSIQNMRMMGWWVRPYIFCGVDPTYFVGWTLHILRVDPTYFAGGPYIFCGWTLHILRVDPTKHPGLTQQRIQNMFQFKDTGSTHKVCRVICRVDPATYVVPPTGSRHRVRVSVRTVLTRSLCFGASGVNPSTTAVLLLLQVPVARFPIRTHWHTIFKFLCM
jgi:hypothetical protein